MKESLIIILLGLIVLTGQSQDALFNFEEAKAQAQESNRHILLVFSGSDWCKPCIQFRKDIVESTAFLDYSRDHLVHLELDFPYSKKNKLSKDQMRHNERLADQYNPAGVFPKIILVDSEGKFISDLDYKKGLKPQDFINQLESIEYD